MKKTLSFLLSLILVVGIITSVPVTAFAIDSGTCGDNLTWTLDNEGTLTINGTGDMNDYDCWNSVFAPWYDTRSDVKTVIISDGITSLGDWAFSYCENLTAITIPQNITHMGNYTFYSCKKLPGISIPKNVTALGTAIFCNCENISSITLSENITSIGWYAFQYCSKLTEIFIPDSVKTIGDMAFSHCTNLTAITIPQGITGIGICTFEYCENLTSIDIPQGVTNIGLMAFYNCKKLENVTIPEGVTTIGYCAFSDCLNLTSITIPQSVTTIEDKAFGYYTVDKQKYEKVENFRIYAMKGSAAETYAYENECAFENSCMHASSNWIVSKEPTCESVGFKYLKCTICQTELKFAEIPATGHTLSKWIIGNNPTCTVVGAKHKECVVCKAIIETQTSPAKGHTASSWIVSKKATVNAAGSKYQKCTVCGVKIKTEKIAQLKCAAPKLKAVSNVATGIKFTWNKVTGADNYEIYRKTGNGAWKKLATVKGTVTTYTDKTAKSGTTYKYTVKAKNEAGLSKYNTTGLTIKCLADPVLKAPTSTKKGITLKWNKVTDAQGYVVYRKAGNGKLTKLATVKGISKISYTDKSAKKGTKYTYQIKAYSGKTYSAYSNAKTIKDKY